MRLTIDTLDGARDQTIKVRRMINLGSATRDVDTAIAHQQEVADEGIRIAFDVPAPRIYPIASINLTAAASIGVQGPRTSGEVEIVLIEGEELLVTVGSDHTDRDLERTSIPWSKQACANVIARTAWRWAEVADHWDSMRLECDVDGEPYQRVGVDAFLEPIEILAIVHERADLPAVGLVVYCGTYVSITGTLRFGREWEIRLIDPVLGRTIAHRYSVDQLLTEVHPEYRVPLVADS